MPACWQSSITNESIVYPQAEAENVSPVSFFSFSSFFFTTVKTGLCSPEGVFAMVSYGVDVSKGWVDIARTDNSRRRKQADHIANEEAALAAYWRAQQQQYPDLVVTVESTGMYHLELVRVCLSLDIPLRLVNPIITKQLARASVRRIKTDRKDAFRIAQLGLTREGYLVTEQQLAPTRFYLRADQRLASAARRLESSKQQYKLAGVPTELLDATFDPCCQALMAASARLRLEGSMTCDGGLLLLLQSLPGFGPVIAATVIGEIGSIGRFSRPKQLVAFMGIDPAIRRSGTFDQLYRSGYKARVATPAASSVHSGFCRQALRPRAKSCVPAQARAGQKLPPGGHPCCPAPYLPPLCGLETGYAIPENYLTYDMRSFLTTQKSRSDNK